MGDVPVREGTTPAVLIHAVSLGEVNATRLLVHRLQELRPDLHIIISTTTETAHARAQELYTSPSAFPDMPKSRITVIRYPLDFTSAITRLLDRLRPTVVALIE